MEKGGSVLGRSEATLLTGELVESSRDERSGKQAREMKRQNRGGGFDSTTTAIPE